VDEELHKILLHYGILHPKAEFPSSLPSKYENRMDEFYQFSKENGIDDKFSPSEILNKLKTPKNDKSYE